MALDLFERVAEKHEDNADILFIIGDLKSQLNDIDGALIYYQQAYNKDNSLILALEVAAELALRSNHRDSELILKKLFLQILVIHNICNYLLNLYRFKQLE
ncbi:MAG: hypothetical protein Ct9H300mP18_04330 [Candidatus Neomarinimicrobiota bacterium]|nr:MAG: hypothetical protein Ct9H300mP18_04330 [Candidatus Neomarinimicrobiota bacterium]